MLKFNKADEFHVVFHAHFLIDRQSLFPDGLDPDVTEGRDLFEGFAGNKHVKDGFFTRREPVQEHSERRRRCLPLVVRRRFQGFADVMEKSLAVQRFFQEFERPALNARAQVGTSPWAVIKMIGSLMPSSTRHS